MMLTKCSFERFGCDEQFAPSDEANHHVEYADSHALMVQKAFEQEQKEKAAIDAERAELRKVTMTLMQRSDQILVVNQNDPNAYHSIASAIQVANKGDTVRVCPGDYKESVYIPAGKIVRVESMTFSKDTPPSVGGRREWIKPDVRILSTDGTPAVVSESFCACFIGCEMMVNNYPNPELPQDTPSSILVKGPNATLSLKHCLITSAVGDGVHCTDKATLDIKDCVVHKCKRTGVRFTEGSGGQVANSKFEYNGTGVFVSSDADPTVTLCQMRESVAHGINVSNRGRGIFQDNKSSENQGAGMVVGIESSPLVKYNQLTKNMGGGLVIRDRSKGNYGNNNISENNGPGVSVGFGADPHLTQNIIHSGEMAGIVILEQGKGCFEENDVLKNFGPQLSICEGGNPTVRNCTFHDGKTGLLSSGGTGLIEDCHFHALQRPVTAAPGSHPVLKRNRIDNCKEGVLVENEGVVTFENNVVTGIESCGVTVGVGGDAEIIGNKVHHGIFVFGRATVANNHVQPSGKGEHIYFTPAAAAVSTSKDNTLL